VLSGYPHLEEAYWFAEGVLPILAERGLWTTPAAAPHQLAPTAPEASVPFAGAPVQAVSARDPALNR
jgi:alkanesulfonate monooxygenase